MINNTARLFLTLIVTLVLTGCCCSNPNYQQSNSSIATNYRAIEVTADQFGQSLANHILNNPDIANDIHCKIIPSKTMGILNDVSSENTYEQKTKIKQLCTLRVDEYEPVYVTKVTFFIKTEEGNIHVLDNLLDSGNSSFSHFNFSENGKYLYITFTDEGHPFFVFFDTIKFINNDKEHQVGEVFEEYFLDHIEHFYDNGDFVFALGEGTITGCLDGEIEIEPKTANSEEVKRCLFHHNIFDEYNSFSSSEPYIPSRSERQIEMPYVCKAFH